MAGNADFLSYVNSDVVKTEEIEKKIKMSTAVVENDSPVRPAGDEAMEPMETAHELDELPEDPLKKMESDKSLNTGKDQPRDLKLDESNHAPAESGIVDTVIKSESVENTSVKSEAVDNIIVTSAMIEEEARLEDEGEKREREIMEKHEQIWKDMTQDEQAEKYRKLQYLLTKSNMYTEYLIDRMKQQKESKKIREEKRLKRLANKKAQEEKQTEEMKKKEDEKNEKDVQIVEETKKELLESPKLQRRTRGRKTDSDFEYSQESTTSRKSVRNNKGTPVGSPPPSSQTPNTGKRKTRNGTLDSFLVSSQESNSTQSETPVRSSRKRKKFEEEENEAPIDMETFSQSSQTSVMSTASTRSRHGKKSRLEEIAKMSEIAIQDPVLTSPRSNKSQVLSQSSQKNNEPSSQTLDTPKTKSSIKLRNSPRLSKSQEETVTVQKEEISSPKSSNLKNSSTRSKGNEMPQGAGSDVKDTTSNDRSPKATTNDSDNENNNEEDEKRIINGEEVLDNQPVLFTGGVLRQYQIDGYNWLETLYENGINGILADEMGLGKTVQCVAIISHLVNMGIIGPFLVVGPLSTLPNWFSEFKRFTPKVPVILYHGTKEERAGMRSKIRKKVIIREGVAVRPVVITSYEIAMIDKLFMSKQEWKYLIVDEGHRIKNSQCRLIKELRTYDSTHRLLLTGTPLQNNLAELWSLLNFLLPEIFDDLGSFESWFDIQNISDEAANEKIIAEEKENNILSMLHQILRPFMLRRLKSDVDLLIPPKKEILVYAPMTAEQQEMYRFTVDKTILQKIEEKNTEKEVIEYNEAGRPKRKSAGKVNYELMFENQIENDLLDGKKHRKQAKAMEKDEEDLEAWVAAIGEMYEDRNKGKAVKAKKSQVTVRLQNIMMQLRKCCNHPYLLEHPIDQETGDLKLDECIINKSGKMMVLDKMLAELKKRGHKVLIFSQMTKMMDLLEDFCVIRDYNYCRLDGSSKMSERKEQMESFNDPDGDMFVFLLSTRAGGLGINLTGADTCIIYDSDWNPQCDLQAQDRCHRIGQTKPVVVYRYITVNTIDQKIVERAAAKRKLEKMVIHKGKFKKGITEESEVEMKPMSPEELLSLLESKDHCSIMSGKEGSVISQDDLDQLLDRSDLYKKWDQKKEAAKGIKPAKKKKTKKQGEVKKVKGTCFKVVDMGDDDERRSSLESETTASTSRS